MKRRLHPLIISLREIRRERNIKQYDLAKKIGVNSVAVCQWETGRRTPHWLNIVCWADALGVEITIQERENAAQTEA